MLEWLVIGGGIHGTHLAHVLVNRYFCPRHKIRILDPHTALLSHWFRNTGNTGMRYLRSTSVHHIDIIPHSMWYFAKTKEGAKLVEFMPGDRYHRPSLKFFNAHARKIIADHNLEELRIKGHATDIYRIEKHWQIESNNGTIAAKRIMLATGLGNVLNLPGWTATIDRRFWSHVLDPDGKIIDTSRQTESIVLGGGITAVQTALHLSRHLENKVHILSPHHISTSEFDSDPEWIHHRMPEFLAAPNYNERREVINKERAPGTIPAVLELELAKAVQRGKIELSISPNYRVQIKSKKIVLLLDYDRTSIPTSISGDHVFLCTGYTNQRPGGTVVDKLIEREGLPVAPCGFPILQKDLAWGQGLYATGPLAELEIGPVSRNIVGARQSAERLSFIKT